MAQKLIKQGYKIVKQDEKAEIYIINTCTVTNMSDRKSRQMIRKAKESNPNSKIIVLGCYAQVAKNELEQIKEIDIVLGNDEKVNIVEYCNNIINEKIYKEELEKPNKKEYAEFGTITYTEKTRAVIKVQDGCDRFCTYCIIPYARGRIKSRKPQNVVEEIERNSQKWNKRSSNNRNSYSILWKGL